jgi:hypothetical protein
MLAVMAVYSLSIHADYRCRHSGACCTADWDVPVELPALQNVDEALTAEESRRRELRPKRCGAHR